MHQHTPDKNCLNCQTPLQGKYCHVCGQKANLVKDSLGSVIIHFIGHYFHYDGKFMHTIKSMLFKPGQITLDYIQGKRARYLNPIQLYIFVSTLFFLMVFAVNPLEHSNPEDSKPDSAVKDTSTTLISPKADTISTHLEPATDTTADKMANPLPANNPQNKFNLNEGGVEFSYGINPDKYKDLAEYDSIMNSLPDSLKHNRLESFIYRRLIKLNTRFNDENDLNYEFMSKVYRTLPKALFVLLPLFAFFLKLVYINRKIYYIDHLIFSIYDHVISFLVVSIGILISVVPISFMNEIESLISLGLFIFLWIYQLMAMKKVYGGTWFSTIIRQLFLKVSYFIAVIICLVFLLTYSLLSI